MRQHKFRNADERAAHMVASFEILNTQTCGNCRHWAHSSFQDGDPNWAPCAWPHIIKPRHSDKKTADLPAGVDLQHKQMPRDGGHSCQTFLRDKSPEETPATNKRIP